jgi:hypothetical protein
MLPTNFSTVGLRLRRNRLACGRILGVICDAVAAGEKFLISCAEEQSKYLSSFAVTSGPYDDLTFTSWGRWQCRRGGADVRLNSYYAVCGCGTEYRCGALPGEGLWGHY